MSSIARVDRFQKPAICMLGMFVLGGIVWGGLHFNRLVTEPAAGQGVKSSDPPIATRSLPPDPPTPKLDEPSQRLLESVAGSSPNANSLARLALEALLAEKAQALTRDALNDQQRCQVIASWIVDSVDQLGLPALSNAERLLFGSAMATDVSRARLFERMLAFLNIEARMLTAYNENRTTNQRVFVQARFDGQWHLYDLASGVTYQDDGKVLSWDQIRAAPDRAASGMTVLGSKSSPPQEGILSAEFFKHAGTFGFYRGDDVKLLKASTNMEYFHQRLQLGSLDGRWNDLQDACVHKHITQYLPWCLGTRLDTFHLHWTLYNLTSTKTYVVRFYFIDAPEPGLRYWAKCTGGTIATGAHFVGGDRKKYWAVTIHPELHGNGRLELDFGYDFRGIGQGAILDHVVIDSFGH